MESKFSSRSGDDETYQSHREVAASDAFIFKIFTKLTFFAYKIQSNLLLSNILPLYRGELLTNFKFSSTRFKS